MDKKIARVLPRKTNATPEDDLVFFGPPPLLILPEIDEVHISVTFTYDKQRAEELAEDWRWAGVPVKLGGPAYDDNGELEEIKFYLEPMDDERFERDVASIPGVTVYAVHRMK